jgi:translocator protein
MTRTTLGASTLAVVAAAGIGSAANRSGSSRWYQRLRKPSYVPPSHVFPIAWTLLYADIAASSAGAIDDARATGQRARPEATSLLWQPMVLNAGWGAGYSSDNTDSALQR